MMENSHTYSETIADTLLWSYLTFITTMKMTSPIKNAASTPVTLPRIVTVDATDSWSLPVLLAVLQSRSLESQVLIMQLRIPDIGAPVLQLILNA